MKTVVIASAVRTPIGDFGRAFRMERQDLNLGISSLCAGGGVGTAILVEQ